jgi:hypothetical protein
MSDDAKAAEAAKAEAEAKAKQDAERLLEAARAAGIKIYEESQMKEVIAGRDEAKRKLREREESDKKAADAKLIEDGRVAELLKQREAELKQEKQSRQALEIEATAFREQQKALRQQALDKITDVKIKAIAEKLPNTSDIIDLAELHTQNKIGVDGTKGRKGESGADDPKKLRAGENFDTYTKRLREEGHIRD